MYLWWRNHVRWRFYDRDVSGMRLVLALLMLAGCASDEWEADVSIAPPDLSSTAFTDGGDIPVTHTCDGDDLPLPLSWDGSHPDAVEIVLIIDDPDAPGGTFVHWLVAGLPEAGSIVDGELPPGAVEGVNSFGGVGYRGPCPPPGDAPHTYRIEVIGVAEPTGLASGFTLDELEQATAGHQLSSANLTGRYGR
jgi:Raf kinase inhibitor-like YbhB/YbcL family protein